MNDRDYIVKTIHTIKRLKNSINGNPRFDFTFTDGSHAELAPDASFGYEVGNPGYREDCRVGVTYDKRGRVAYMTKT